MAKFFRKNSYFSYLFENRSIYPAFTFQWGKAWIKRLINSKKLIQIIYRVTILKKKGVFIGRLSVINTKLIEGKMKNLSLGDECFIGKNVYLALHAEIKIGNKVVINDDSKLLTGSHDINSPVWESVSAPIIINDYAWVASNVIILPGVSIGKGAVIGAGAVVTKNVPDYHVVAGNPATFIKLRQKQNFIYSPIRWLSPFEAWMGLKNTPDFEVNNIE